MEGKEEQLEELFTAVKNSRPAEATEIKDLTDRPDGSPQPSKSSSNVRRSIKSLFTAAPKFQKNLKRFVSL